MRLKPLFKGLLTYVPGAMRLGRGATGGSDSARYCYSVWLRHLVLAQRAGLPVNFDTVAELGPGDSLGTGLAALLCGARRYLAFDVVRYAPNQVNARILDELVELFRARTPIPGDDELPDVKPKLDDYAFPGQVLGDERLARALAPERVAAIRSALVAGSSGEEIEIDYRVPWHEAVVGGSVDLVFSQACLEHVADLAGAYRAMCEWLRPGGVVSHQIDFRSHGLTPEWDGHRAYPDRAWRYVVGRRPFLLNREPLSVHVQALEKSFRLVRCDAVPRPPELSRSALASRFSGLSDEDLSASGAFLQAVRLN
jgi:SAM-dependent methyltransferase